MRGRMQPAEATDVLEAFRATCYDYADGVPLLAARLGMSATTLYNKANTNDTTHPATLTDGALVILATGSPLIAQAFAHLAGGAFVSLQRERPTGEEALLALVSTWMREQGHFFAEFERAIADGQISAREQRKLIVQAHKVVTACLTLVGQLGSVPRDAA